MRVLIFGAGDLAREGLNVLRRMQSAGVNIDCLGFVADLELGPPEQLCGLTVFNNLLAFGGEPSISFCVAVGEPKGRAAIVARLAQIGAGFTSLIDPLVCIGSDSTIGNGTIAFGHSSISVNCTIGQHVVINPGCTVAHDSCLCDFVSLSPGVHLAGHSVCHQECFLGVGAVVRPRITIGKKAYVGAGAVVVRDVPQNAIVAGNPARSLPKSNENSHQTPEPRLL